MFRSNSGDSSARGPAAVVNTAAWMKRCPLPSTRSTTLLRKNMAGRRLRKISRCPAPSAIAAKEAISPRSIPKPAGLFRYFIRARTAGRIIFVSTERASNPSHPQAAPRRTCLVSTAPPACPNGQPRTPLTRGRSCNNGSAFGQKCHGLSTSRAGKPVSHFRIAMKKVTQSGICGIGAREALPRQTGFQLSKGGCFFRPPLRRLPPLPSPCSVF